MLISRCPICYNKIQKTDLRSFRVVQQTVRDRGRWPVRAWGPSEQYRLAGEDVNLDFLLHRHPPASNSPNKSIFDHGQHLNKYLAISTK